MRQIETPPEDGKARTYEVEGRCDHAGPKGDWKSAVDMFVFIGMRLDDKRGVIINLVNGGETAGPMDARELLASLNAFVRYLKTVWSEDTEEGKRIRMCETILRADLVLPIDMPEPPEPEHRPGGKRKR